MRRLSALLVAALALTGCVTSDASLQTSAGFEQIAAQRMSFAAEAVCLNNTTRSRQDRAARSLNFPIRDRDGNTTVYINPGTLTFLRIGPVPEQALNLPGRPRQVYRGNGCSVGSPAVGLRDANRLVGEILAPRLVDGSPITSAPVGAGTNSAGGVGFFFDDVAVTLPIASTTFTNPDTGQSERFDHPVILIIHK
ncbi:hypothetical protein JANAI62_17560 [Jannaschia pagri]|uniref:Uncharacterized protein n=1 Tax=Jannaschia pagri TaxID=2829797 RepID=A0ABQ4NL39_9RHOB|nr:MULTISPECIES: hypothetical protein [unclassified Jannaschia]GIT91300.1 hypothetical protein JANAI61_17580 [Jannaschia sp. AI_61]GIT95133.1 hypothetical protein JANAI62_17560 [Jannaschia sp. AI_62]